MMAIRFLDAPILLNPIGRTHEQRIEFICRKICIAEGIDPDMKIVIIDPLLPSGKRYKLWEAKRPVALALIECIDLLT